MGRAKRGVGRGFLREIRTAIGRNRMGLVDGASRASFALAAVEVEGETW